jgi:hypothetical protein
VRSTAALCAFCDNQKNADVCGAPSQRLFCSEPQDETPERTLLWKREKIEKNSPQFNRILMFSRKSMKKHVLALCALLVPLGMLFALQSLNRYTLLPLDQLNTMFLPYSAHYKGVEVQNHFLTDAIAQVYPYKVRLRDNVLRGEVASWNPSILGGHPHYASTSFTHFDPTNLVLLLGDMPHAYDWQMILKLLIAGVGMYWLLGLFVKHPMIRATAATAYMLNSMFITTLQHQWVLGAMCWMPSCVRMLWQALESPTTLARLNYLLVASVFLGLAFLGGSLQTSAMAVLLVTVLVFTHGWMQAGSVWKHITKPLAVLAVLGVVAFALTAFMWLPAIELFVLNINTRAAGKPFSLWNGFKTLPLLTSFAFPELLGSPRGFDLAKLASADMNDCNAAAGFLMLLAGAWGAVNFWHPRRALWRTERGEGERSATTLNLRPFILLMIAGLVLPLFTPLYKFLYHRSFVVYVFGLVVVGAVAMEHLLVGGVFGESSERERLQFGMWLRRSLNAVVMMLLGLLVASTVTFLFRDSIEAVLQGLLVRQGSTSQLGAGNIEWMMGRVSAFLQHFSVLNVQWMSAIIIVIAALRAWYEFMRVHTPQLPALVPALLSALGKRLQKNGGKQMRQQRFSKVCALIFLSIAGQTVLFGYSWLPCVDMERYPLYPETPATRFLQHDSLGSRLSGSRVFPVWVEGNLASQRLFQPNTLDIYGISTLQGYESLFPTSVERIVGVGAAPNTQQLRLLGLVNVRYLAISGKLSMHHAALRLVNLGADTAVVKLYENPYWKGRAWVAYKHEVLPEASSQLARMNDSTAAEPFDGSTVLLFDAPQGFSADKQVLATNDERKPSQTVARLTHAENNRVRLDVQTAQAGWLVLADTWYPGWKAFVSGNETPVLKANYAMRAVRVPAGKSVVEFRFEPPLLRWGSYVSAVALFGVVMVIVVGKRCL